MLAWTAMMALMMAPTVAPWVHAYFRFGVADLTPRRRAGATTVFAAGYVAMWAIFGVVAVAIELLVPDPGRYRGLALVGAGLYQLSPLKRACLVHCRNPLTFLLTRTRNLARSGFHLGLVHGLYCLGCCWALMLTAIAVGAINLWWMAALALLTFTEQVSSLGGQLRIPLGVFLIAWGTWVGLAHGS